MRVWLLFAASLVLAAPARAASDWHFLAPDNSGLYGEIHRELQARLPAEIKLHFLALNPQTGPLPRGARWLAAGSQSLRRIWQEQPDALVISLLNSRDSVEALRQATKASGPYTALYHDPEPLRQMRLAKAVIPRLDELGLLVTPAQEAELAELQRQSTRLGIRLVARKVAGNAELVPRLVDVLKHSDALLALPAPGIINRQTLKTILLTAYRHERVLIGSSEAMVSAGSLATTHSTPAQTAEHLAAWLRNFAPERPPILPEPEYTRSFTVSYNQQVAHSLSLRAPDLPSLENQLLEAERVPSPGVSAP